MSKMYDNITGRSPIATDDLGYIGTGNKASDIFNNGTIDYNDLNNKPTINNVELQGNLLSSDLGLQPELTEEQTNAVNSGITAALTDQITTNENNISSEQAKTTGMSEGGSNYITVGGIRVYVSATAPTGARTGDLWIGG